MHVVLISHWFPPTNIIGAIRPYQIARHFADQGDRVTVICTGESNFDQNLESDLSGIEVLRYSLPWITKYLEPSRAARSPFTKAMKGILRLAIYPDPFFLAAREIKTKARGLASARDSRIDLIISSALPFSTHVAARQVAKKLCVPWIADNRDLWALSPYRKSPRLLRYLDRAFERKILRDADACTVIGDMMKEALEGQIGPNASKRVFVIRNGADKLTPTSAGQDQAPMTGKLLFTYSGGLYSGYRDPTPVFDALAHLGLNCSIDFYGSEQNVVAGYIDKYPTLEITSHARVSHDAIQQIQERSNFLILALGSGKFEKGVLTGKFYEYIAARKPIIAICDEDSELAGLISKYELGIASRSPSRISEFIKDYISGRWTLGAIPVELTREHQLSRLRGMAIGIVDSFEQHAG
ncbi:glycosyltransferase family 4 protein [Candidimonas humi]|uniref:Glycosyltransferase family 4 protein n=1 Tax=Candidimonas humi TaxID=683355 RepID=A0ABV8NX02_9BURK|nr:glycosyltransferase family 4 protein [Candidimonas humi]MBV6305080.1 glycosyltransferase family 4 protein [Candidimonas humi]